MENIDFFSDLDADMMTSVKISPEQIIQKIEESLTFILNKTFPLTAQKRQIVPLSNRINIACPYCKDSLLDKNKKRGNIYTENLWYKCYNCEKSTPFYKLISDFDSEDIFTMDELFYLEKNVKSGEFSESGGLSIRKNHKIIDIFSLQEIAIPRSEIMKKMDLVNIHQSQKILKYLEDRKQLMNYGSTYNHFAYDRMKDILYIFNLTPDKQNVIGMQGRFNDKKMQRIMHRRFDSYQYSDILIDIFEIDEEKIDPEIKSRVNNFSLIYNIMNVDFSTEVYSFEGAIDSHHMFNSIASLSSSAKVHLPNVRFFYDNTTIDKTGLDRSIELLNKYEYVFLWKKFLRDYPDYRFCKDLNDVFKKKPIDQLKLTEYFSNDPLDMIDL